MSVFFLQMQIRNDLKKNPLRKIGVRSRVCVYRGEAGLISEEQVLSGYRVSFNTEDQHSDLICN